MRHLLEVERLSTGYGQIEVVRDVTFAAPRGAIVALLGPSGAGKTTTLRAITGLLPVRDGVVRFRGERIDGLGPAQIASRGVALMPERGSVFSSLTVEDNLRLGHDAARGEPRGFDEARAQALELFPHLGSMLDREAGTLSGGEQQMVALARVFLARPDVLLLDEISMGLAPKVVSALYEPVARLRDEGVTVVLVEQQLEHALRLADVCYVMVSGQITLVAEPAELRKGTAAVAGYFGS